MPTRDGRSGRRRPRTAPDLSPGSDSEHGTSAGTATTTIAASSSQVAGSAAAAVNRVRGRRGPSQGSGKEAVGGGASGKAGVAAAAAGEVRYAGCVEMWIRSCFLSVKMLACPALRHETMCECTVVINERDESIMGSVRPRQQASVFITSHLHQTCVRSYIGRRYTRTQRYHTRALVYTTTSHHLYMYASTDGCMSVAYIKARQVQLHSIPSAASPSAQPASSC